MIISEVELDEWRSGAQSEGSLRFDLSSALAIPGLLLGGNALTLKADAENAVVIGNEENELLINDKGINAKVKDVEMTISDEGITVRGDFTVKGDLTYEGELKSG